MKKLRTFLALTCLMCCLALLAGCGGDTPKDTTPVGNEKEANYSVTVRNALGEPQSGVIVRFMNGGEQVSMQVTDENGTAAKTLTKGEYTVELAFTDSQNSYHSNADGLTLTAEKPAGAVELAYALGGEPTPLGEGQAYPVQAGCTWVNAAAGSRSYYLFTPTEAGTYEISVVGSGVAVGYYGTPHFVQTENAIEVEDNRFTISVSADMVSTGNTGTTVLVIGVDALDADVTGCTLIVRRIGDAEFDPATEPWTVYEPTVTVSPYTLPAGAKLREFDLSAATGTYNLVFSEADGFYHLDSADGPLVLVRLTEPTPYLEAIATILREYSGMGKYFFGENGEFLKKESYTECLLTYSDNADKESGVYPLTQDLMYMLQQRGEYVGWWDAESPSCLFLDQNGALYPNVNLEHAWLFLCCYIEG